jgi:nucleotide-binding universal stress UspA family protein
MDRVVVPVHVGQTSHAALDLAARVAREIHLMTVCSEDEEPKAEEHLRRIAANVPNAKTSVVRGGDPEEEIVRFASRNDADAIFLNANTEPSERKIDIIRHATVPVMIVP